MLIGALKLTHDSACAIMEDDQLLFSAELEKLNNNKRHIKFTKSGEISEILKMYGMGFSDINTWIIDGWWQNEKNIYLDGEKVIVNNYHNALNKMPESNIYYGTNSILGNYKSYSHIYSHLCASYCTSPFAAKNESSYVLVFDGGTKPVLYFYNSEEKKFEYLGALLKFGGDIYASLASRFEPYKNMRSIVDGKEKLNIYFAGKVMAYIAMGKFNEVIYDFCVSEYSKLSDDNGRLNDWRENRKFEFSIVKEFADRFNSADILYNFHMFIQNELVASLRRFINRNPKSLSKICLSGGSMLNIKWNTAIRNCGLFSEVYAPPFVNDSGAAIGNLCAELMTNGKTYLHWNTYMGPSLTPCQVDLSWSQRKCSIEELANIIANSGEPVVVLNGRAELGPRALGNRSIIADARNVEMKDKINWLKKRESYRPVAPICIEEDAPLFFEPGTPDKYMLFEHSRGKRADEIPAVFHLDNTARLQTVTKEDNPIIYELLLCYKKITGISVLCNTSANYLGKGFFPDVRSAQDWGMCKYIWSEEVLYEKFSN